MAFYTGSRTATYLCGTRRGASSKLKESSSTSPSARRQRRKSPSSPARIASRAWPTVRPFTERLWLAFAAAQRGALGFAILYLDLDSSNLSMTRLATRSVMLPPQQVAGRLKGCARESDVVARLVGVNSRTPGGTREAANRRKSWPRRSRRRWRFPFFVNGNRNQHLGQYRDQPLYSRQCGRGHHAGAGRPGALPLQG